MRLHHESMHDALHELVAALGGTKKVGALLRPSMSVEDAARWVRDCLNHDRREKLGPEELLHLLREGRRVGCHAVMGFLAAEAGYAVPMPLEPADEAAQLQREFIDAVRAQQRMVERLRHLGALPARMTT